LQELGSVGARAGLCLDGFHKGPDKFRGLDGGSPRGVRGNVMSCPMMLSRSWASAAIWMNQPRISCHVPRSSDW
jgi:hypothetical protein